MEDKDQDSEQKSDQNGRANYAVDIEDLDGPQPELAPPSQNYIGLTSSKLRDQQGRPELPRGVKAVGVLLFIGAIISFLDSSQYSQWFVLGNTLVLVLAVGLFARSNVARWLVMGLSSALVVLAILSLAAFVQASARFNNAVDHYHQLIAGVQNEQFTPSQIQDLQTQDKEIKRLEKQVGKAKTMTYFKYGFMIVAYSGIVLYLHRPKIREAFHTAGDL